MEYMITSDETGDYFVIPVSKAQDWEDFLYTEECAYGGQYPDWAHYIGGFASCIKFQSWSIR